MLTRPRALRRPGHRRGHQTTQRARLRAGLPAQMPAACSRERRLGAREGLEPSKPLGRQIYSLLRLTASLPRQLAVVVENECFGSYLRPAKSVDGAGEGIRTPDLLITNQLLYQTELRQPKQKGNYSTSRASGAICARSNLDPVFIYPHLSSSGGGVLPVAPTRRGPRGLAQPFADAA